MDANTRGPDSPYTPSELIQMLKPILRFHSDLDYSIFLLWVVHTYMRDILPSSVCLYLAFDGKKSSGKTTATEISVFLADNGKMVYSPTTGALKRLLDNNVVLGIDEIDENQKSNEILWTILREGNKWDASTPLCDKTSNGWKVIECNVGGPKVFNYRGEIDDALRSRTLVINMPSIKDVSLSVDGLFLENRLNPIKNLIEYNVTDRLNDGWDSSKIEKIMSSETFKLRVAKVNPDLGRGYQQTAILLMVNDIMSWNLDDTIKEFVESQESEDPFETEKEILANIWLEQRQIMKDGFLADSEAEVIIPSEELRSRLNQELEEKHLKPISKQRFSVLKRELGWKEGVNARKSSAHRGKMMLTFDSTVLTNLELEGHS